MTSDSAASDIEMLEEQLNSFDSSDRAEALCMLSGRVDSGDISTPHTKDEVNLHFHTFFSYNANGWSPSRVAWEAKKYGLEAAGIVDFDVLDGMEEFLAAGEIIGIRTTAALESRVFIREYSDKIINSPNEPGVAYFMVGGCYRLPEPGSTADDTLRTMRQMAERRNLQVVELVNPYLDKVQLDYESDVIPLTPSGNATERHLLAAYDAKARKVFGDDESALVSFWAKALELTQDEAAALIANTPAFHEKMRGKLMKAGGVGYVAASPETFPSVELVIDMAKGMEALPTAAWLDGTNPGEADMPAMLNLLASKGVVAINIIPDRNWNIKNPEERQLKVEHLGKVIAAAKEFDFPICVGTEMNKGGLPFVDDFSSDELKPYVEDFLDGAYFFWGHTALARNAGMGYSSDWAEFHFGNDRANKNKFYTRIGRYIDPINASTIHAGNLRSGNPAEVLRAVQR